VSFSRAGEGVTGPNKSNSRGRSPPPPAPKKGSQKLQTPFFLLPRAHFFLRGGATRKSQKRKKGREGFKLNFLLVGGSRR